jgi:hypothetical protein
MATRSDSEKRRSDERLEFITKCRLDINGNVLECIVDNISTVGAAIELVSSDEHSLHVGETGTLHVLLLSPVSFQCKVVRVGSTQIGVEFLSG